MSATVERALSLARGLDDPKEPTCCLACFSVIGAELHAAEQGKSPLLEELRDNHPEFWDACISFVTLPRTEDDFPALRSQLFRNIRQCLRRSQHTGLYKPGGKLEPVRLLLEVLYMSLLCALARGQHPMVNKPKLKMPKGFGTKRGRWPDSVDKLFPHGERETVEMHVFWCSLRFTQACYDVFACTILVARPLSFPHLLASPPMHAQMVYVLAQLLHGDVTTAPAGWQGDPPMKPPVDKILPLSFEGTRHMLTEPPIHFLRIIFEGLDVKNNDYFAFFIGYDRVLFHALQAASRRLSKSDELFESASRVIKLLYIAFRIPLAEVDQRVVSTWPEGYDKPGRLAAKDTRAAMAQLVILNLKQLIGFRGCSGPDCGKTVHGHEGRPFSACASCKIVRYCDKACQQRGWKSGPWRYRHKDICPILRCLPIGGESSEPQFVDAFKFLSTEDQIKVYQWSATGGSLFSSETTRLFRLNFQRINDSVGGFPNTNPAALEEIVKKMLELFASEESVGNTMSLVARAVTLAALLNNADHPVAPAGGATRQLPGVLGLVNSFLTTARTHDDLPKLRDHLAENVRNCKFCAEHNTVVRSNFTDLVYVLGEALYMVLLSCLARGQHPLLNRPKMPKGFGTRRGRWPETVQKLFPFGAQQTVQMHIFWSSLRFSTGPMAVLSSSFLIARPLVLPHLSTPGLCRAQFIYILAQALQADVAAVPAGWEGVPAVDPAASADLPLANPLDRPVLTQASIHFLRALADGPDANPYDHHTFFDGYERVIFPAILAASRRIDASHAGFRTLAQFLQLLHKKLGLAVSAVDDRVRAVWPEPAPNVTTDVGMAPYVTLLNLRQIDKTRGCTSPGCGKTVHDNGGKPFATCSRCKTGPWRFWVAQRWSLDLTFFRTSSRPAIYARVWSISWLRYSIETLLSVPKGGKDNLPSTLPGIRNYPSRLPTSGTDL
ncbi:hypothetical protein AURDEDRAFT_183345 [Auricularia subglabra TFB-10046 SS5]|nr:hypothetical protein AURDEDRAFT_183345 [Auricularia subglabra TFB-10046 SS5]